MSRRRGTSPSGATGGGASTNGRRRGEGVETARGAARGAAPSASTAKRVAVLGGGPSGLTTVKACLEEGHIPVCFEQDEDIGGLWRFTEKEGHSSVYRSTVINSSKEFNCFSDFPIPDEMPPFLHHEQLMDYFRSYAAHFELERHVRLRRRVVAVEALEGGAGYDVTTEDGGERRGVDRETERFDAVAVCTGHHWDPNVPAPWPGQDKFQGRVMHSHSYKDAVGFDGKRVVVVGVGNSGVDIAVELSHVAKHVSLSTRSGAWIAHRMGFGKPIDHIGNNRLINMLPRAALAAVGTAIHDMVNGDVDKFGLTPKHGFLAAHPTINDHLIPRVVTGDITVHPNIEEFSANGVTFEDGAHVEADVVILCTGYNLSFPFLSKSCGVTVADNHVDLYKYVWPAEATEAAPMAFIGLIQPLGSIMPISELQARWFAQVVSGNLALPRPDARRRDMQRKAVAMARRYKRSKRHTIQVDYIPYCDELAQQFGAKPRFARLLCTDPKLFLACFLRPAVPVQYRLHGPHAWSGARSTLLHVTDKATVAAATRTRAVPKGEMGGAMIRRVLACFSLLALLLIVLGSAVLVYLTGRGLWWGATAAGVDVDGAARALQSSIAQLWSS